MDGGEDGGTDGGICGDLCQTGGPKDPSCGDPCVADVCNLEPSCCQSAWDPFCVDVAVKFCGVQCSPSDGGGFDGGTPVCGNECVPQPAPMSTSCSPCAATVCGFDPYCCNTSWDLTCAQEAQQFCGICGGFDGGGLDAGGWDGGGFDGGPGSCGDECTPSPYPYDFGCSTCTQTVCSQDPYCCTTSWDPTCVSEAAMLCSGLVCSGADGGFTPDGGWWTDGGGWWSDAGISIGDAGSPEP